MREENHVADGTLVCQQHDEAINADADSGGGRHPVRERADVILVQHHRLFIAALTLLSLVKKTVVLFLRIIQLRKAVGTFHARDEKLKAFGDCRIHRRCFGEWRDWFGKVSYKCWMDQVFFRYDFKNILNMNRNP